MELLGADLQLARLGTGTTPGATQVQGRRQQLTTRNAARQQRAVQRIERLRKLPLPPQLKATLAVACISPLWTYVPIGKTPDIAYLKKLNRSLATAILGHLYPEAAMEIIHSCLVKGHLLNPVQTGAYTLLRLARRHLQGGQVGEQNLQGIAMPHSFLADMETALDRANLRFQFPYIYSSDIYSVLRQEKLSLLDMAPYRQWLHKLRDTIRNEGLAEVADRRLREFLHIRLGADYTTTRRLWDTITDPQLCSMLKRWLTGSVATRERLWRHHRSRATAAPSPYCVWCWHEAGQRCYDALLHVVQHCPRWQHYRQPRFDQLKTFAGELAITGGILPANPPATQAQRKLWLWWQGNAIRLL